MRALLIVGLSCVASVASAAPKQKVAILGLDAMPANGKTDKDTVRVAQDLTTALRTRPKAGVGNWQFAPGSERDLLDEKLLGNCETEAPSCMAPIGSRLGADVLIYGKVENKGSGYQVSIRVLDVAAKKMLVGWVDLLPASDATGTKLQDFARKGYGRLTGAPGPATPAPTTASTPNPPPAANSSCDAAGTMAKGDDLMTMGSYMAALAQYEKALKCGPSVPVTVRAFIVSCRANNQTKAKFYWGKLPADKRQTYAQICIKHQIDVDRD